MFVQATTGSGGWPMSVWLTPELKPFYGGTYYPPEDRYGRIGFLTLLERIAAHWRTEHASIRAKSEEILAGLAQSIRSSGGGEAPLAAGLGKLAYRSIADRFEPDFGGFSEAPKFPRPSTLTFLLRYARDLEPTSSLRSEAVAMIVKTLDGMEAGGLHDHVGGGFHRYSVDRSWHVPHFEKMLYDQAQLAMVYLEGFQFTGHLRYATTVRATLDYVLRELTDAQGGFYSAEDADSLLHHDRPEHAEGAFYVWTADEITQALGADRAPLFSQRYGVQPEGNAPPESDPHQEFTGKNILYRQEPSKEEDAILLQNCLLDLRAWRDRRPRPHLDDKILTAWNGLMISAFARAGATFAEPLYLEAASRAAQFILTHMRTATGGLLRSYREGPSMIAGFASDYAFFIQALLDLHQVTGEVAWLREAWAAQQKMDTLFWDAREGGYFDVSGEDPSILLRTKEDYDGAEPAPNSIAAENLLRFAALWSQDSLFKAAGQVLQARAGILQGSPSAVPQLLAAYLRSQQAPQHLVLVGARDDASARALWRELHRPFLPYKITLWLEPGERLDFLGAQAAFFGSLVDSVKVPTVFICDNYTCRLPQTDPAHVAALLQAG
jgi:uncharacterized protein